MGRLKNVITELLESTASYDRNLQRVSLNLQDVKKRDFKKGTYTGIVSQANTVIQPLDRSLVTIAGLVAQSSLHNNEIALQHITALRELTSRLHELIEEPDLGSANCKNAKKRDAFEIMVDRTCKEFSTFITKFKKELNGILEISQRENAAPTCSATTQRNKISRAQSFRTQRSSTVAGQPQIGVDPTPNPMQQTAGATLSRTQSFRTQRSSMVAGQPQIGVDPTHETLHQSTDQTAGATLSRAQSFRIPRSSTVAGQPRRTVYPMHETLHQSTGQTMGATALEQNPSTVLSASKLIEQSSTNKSLPL